MRSEYTEKAADLENSQITDKLDSVSSRDETMANMLKKDGNNSIQIEKHDGFFSAHGGSNHSGQVSITEEDENFRQEQKPDAEEDKKLAELFEDQVHQNQTKLLVEFLLQDEFPSSIHSSSFDPVNSATSIEEKSIQLYLSRTETDSKSGRQNLKLSDQNQNCKGCCFPSLKKTAKSIN